MSSSKSRLVSVTYADQKAWGITPLARHRNLVHHLDAEAFERHDLPGMVGQQADGVQSQVGEDLRADAVLVLQLPLAIRTLVVHEVAPMAKHLRRARAIAVDAETGAGLVQVNQHSL